MNALGSPNARLDKFIRSMNITRTELALILGSSQPSMSAILSGGRNLSRGMIARIKEQYPMLNVDWLLTGNGEMLKDGNNGSVSSETPSTIPLIPASAFAGKVDGFAPETLSHEECEKITSLVPGAELAIPITGDSMEPDYPNGSIAYIKRINEASFIPWGHTVVMDTENGAFIKRIYPDSEDDGYVWGKSVNPDYPPMHIPKTSIFRIFRVLGTSRIFTTM